ncbi:hypothetical protein D0Y65_023466 [Glycine soja]|uniref:Uncharacterized protein n=1 Tax=Glycine soja TaxID=3848 RepID=A0A445IYD0_GLYSO|nr:hypothetical protein D0Y65_023466 [Glycine soja]
MQWWFQSQKRCKDKLKLTRNKHRIMVTSRKTMKGSSRCGVPTEKNGNLWWLLVAVGDGEEAWHIGNGFGRKKEKEMAFFQSYLNYKAQKAQVTNALRNGNVVHTADVFSKIPMVRSFKDFGAFPGYIVTSLHPDKVDSVIMLGVPFMLPGPSAIENLPKGSYVIKWQEAGRAKTDFVRFDVKSVIRNIYTLFSGSEIPIAGDNQEIMDLYDPTTPLPPWFSEEDLTTYASLYEKSGFRFALQVPYR